MKSQYSHQYCDTEIDPTNFFYDKYNKYNKLKERLKELMPSNRICQLAIPKYYCHPRALKAKNNFRPHIQIINLDVRPRTRLEQLAYPKVRKLLENRDAYKKIFHPKRYFDFNKLIKKSLFSQYSRLANVQAPKKPFMPIRWTEKEWRKHRKILKKLSIPKRQFLAPTIPSRSRHIEKLLPRIKKLCKPKKIFLPTPGPQPKKLLDLKRTLELAKPKQLDRNSMIKPEPIPIDRNKSYKPPKRIVELAKPKDVSAAKSDLKENPFKISSNALNYKLKEGSRLIDLAKPKEIEEPSINPYAFKVKKTATKFKLTPRILKLSKRK